MINGELSRRRFSSPDARFNVYDLATDHGEILAIYAGSPPPEMYEEYIFSGHWCDHHKHGRQFVIKKYRRQKEHQAIKKQHVDQISHLLSN